MGEKINSTSFNLWITLNVNVTGSILDVTFFIFCTPFVSLNERGIIAQANILFVSGESHVCVKERAGHQLQYLSIKYMKSSSKRNCMFTGANFYFGWLLPSVLASS